MSDILFVLSGLLLGLAFKGGMWLFLIPFAGVACALAIMNRPRLPGGKTAPIPVVTRAIRATGLVPATTPDLRSEYKDVPQEYNEPNSTLKVNQVWNRADADIDKAFHDMLVGLRGLVPAANSLLILSRVSSSEWGVRSFYNDGTTQIATDIKIGENSGLLGQLFRPGVDRLLEGDLTGGKALLYYLDNPSIKSIVAVPVFDRNKNRAGALIIDSVYPNAFNTNTVRDNLGIQRQRPRIQRIRAAFRLLEESSRQTGEKGIFHHLRRLRHNVGRYGYRSHRARIRRG